MRTHQPCRGASAPAWLFFSLTALLCACPADDGEDDGAGDASASDETDDESSSESLEIEGEWTDDFMGAHSITSETWSQTFGGDTFTYTIAAFDNEAGTLVAEADTDGAWSKFQWTPGMGTSVYYCQVVFDAASQADAEAAPLADTTDPATGGCGTFAWTLLTPAM